MNEKDGQERMDRMERNGNYGYDRQYGHKYGKDGHKFGQDGQNGHRMGRKYVYIYNYKYNYI